MRDERPRLEELTPRECMRLLSCVSLGRIVFTAHALPAVRLVSHLIDGDHVIVRADRNASITSELTATAGTVVAYEADAVDAAQHLGWSVTLVGVAHQVTDPDEAAAFRRALRHWADGEKDQIISIHAGMVTGFRMAADGTASSGGATPSGDLCGLREGPPSL
jgi:Pyridoxamine 5'-phosphate oxidase